MRRWPQTRAGANHFTPAALGLLHRGALAACDAKDGVGDGILEDPRACTFDPGSLACKAGQKAATVPDPGAGDGRAAHL